MLASQLCLELCITTSSALSLSLLICKMGMKWCLPQVKDEDHRAWYTRDPLLKRSLCYHHCSPRQIPTHLPTGTGRPAPGSPSSGRRPLCA